MKFMQLIFPLTNAPKIHELPAIQAYVFLGFLIVFCVAGNCWKSADSGHSIHLVGRLCARFNPHQTLVRKDATVHVSRSDQEYVQAGLR